jgi:hypothetical protein
MSDRQTNAKTGLGLLIEHYNQSMVEKDEGIVTPEELHNQSQYAPVVKDMQGGPTLEMLQRSRPNYAGNSDRL